MFLTAAVKPKSHSRPSHFPAAALRSAEDVRHQQQSTIHGKTGSLGGISHYCFSHQHGKKSRAAAVKRHNFDYIFALLRWFLNS